MRPQRAAADTLAVVLGHLADAGIPAPDRMPSPSVAIWDRPDVNCPVVFRASCRSGSWGELDPYWFEEDGSINHLVAPRPYDDLSFLVRDLRILLESGSARPPAGTIANLGKLTG